MRKIENLLFPFSSTLDCYHGRWVRNVFDNVRIVKCKERGNQEGGKAYLRSSAGAGLPSLQVLAGLNTKENCSIFVSVAKNRAKQCCRSSFDQSELESQAMGWGPSSEKTLVARQRLVFSSGKPLRTTMLRMGLLFTWFTPENHFSDTQVLNFLWPHCCWLPLRERAM